MLHRWIVVAALFRLVLAASPWRGVGWPPPMVGRSVQVPEGLAERTVAEAAERNRNRNDFGTGNETGTGTGITLGTPSP